MFIEMGEAYITGEVLKWARERRCLSASELAKLIKVQTKQIGLWEAEDAFPPFAKAELIAEKLRIPFGYLFLPERPSDDTPLPDLRTLAPTASTKLSPDALDQIYSVISKQEWYREYLEDVAAMPNAFVGKFTTQNAEEAVAADIRQAIGMSPSIRISRSWEAYLSKLIANAEDIGILVIRSGIVKSSTRRKIAIEEFRGFAIPDTFAPLVYLNGNDSIAARIFTIIHELAHIWIARGGISNANGVDEDSTLSLERYCNKVAAEALVPLAEFNPAWTAVARSDRFNALATKFRVSTMVIIRRAYELGKIGRDEYFEAIAVAKANQKPLKKKKGGDPDRNIIARNSTPLVDAVVKSVRAKNLTYRDASLVLGVGMGQIGKLADGGKVQ
jgi:Zn-dependent peptidase ImmA (M78 family)/transcriptional regulator with XRE-family HTH domain